MRERVISIAERTQSGWGFAHSWGWSRSQRRSHCSEKESQWFTLKK